MKDTSRALQTWPCQASCAWFVSGETVDGAPVLACAGCGTEWTRQQAWTPIDSTGVVPPAVVAEAARR